MSKTLYLECSAGISGDMVVAALLDLGADKEKLLAALASLKTGGFTASVRRVQKCGLELCDFLVELDAEHENHDHDMEYLHGHEHEHEHIAEHGHCHGQEHHSCCAAAELPEHKHCHTHEGEHGHCHGHEHKHEHEHCHGHEHDHSHEHGCGQAHRHAHEHRGLPEILEIIEAAAITERTKELAARIFRIIAEAEAKAHGLPPEEVHFHEVGAVDSIADIVAAAVCLDDLDIGEVVIPRLCEGQGSVRCQHGLLPIPVPATANIIEKYRLPLEITEVQGELVTPTGAAIAAAVCTSFRLPPRFRILRTGLGAGKRSYSRPSILRAMLIEAAEDTAPATAADKVLKIESNIDDCSGELLGYVMDRLLAAGALDVFYTPVYMKKNRPAWQLSLLCHPEEAPPLEQIIFTETTTIGLRKCLMERSCLERRAETAHLSIGELDVKTCLLPDGSSRNYPEYASAVRLAQAKGMSLQQVFAVFQKEV